MTGTNDTPQGSDKMTTMVLALWANISFTYNKVHRTGQVVELRPQHDMVLVKIGEGQFRNFKISKMTDLK